MNDKLPQGQKAYDARCSVWDDTSDSETIYRCKITFQNGARTTVRIAATTDGWQAQTN